jgi:hypothetical protein
MNEQTKGTVRPKEKLRESKMVAEASRHLDRTWAEFVEEFEVVERDK